MSRINYLILFAVLAEICLGNEFAAFCDVCRLVNEKTECPADLSCKESVIEYDGVVSMCQGGHITSLKVYNKGLESLPESLNNMTRVQILNIANNKFEKLVPLPGLVALKTLYIHNNKLKNLTGVFTNSPKVEYISAGNNKLVELPPEWVNMSLKTLNVPSNELETLPIEYRDMNTLTQVDLSQNSLDCEMIRVEFKNTIFADQCIQSQQKTEDDVKPLPLSYTGEPEHAGLDAYEIVAIVLAVLFVCLLVPAIVLYIMYRNKGLSTQA